MALSWLLVAWIGAGAPVAWSQSPAQPGDASPLPTTVIVLPLQGVSPVPTVQTLIPDLYPGNSPLPADVFPGAGPIVPPAADARVWSSPLPWIGVGVLGFGLAAWAALSIGRRARKDA